MRALVVRGDLQSETGWARATRALVSAIQSQFSIIVGVDIHFHPMRSRSKFPFAVVTDAAARDLVSDLENTVILHVCLPGEAVRYADSMNVIWWFWETDKLPHLDWLEHMDAMDLILVPSQWQAGWLGGYRFKTPIAVVRWPHEKFYALHEFRNVPNLEVHSVVSPAQLAMATEIDRSFHSWSNRHRAPALYRKKLAMLTATASSFEEISNKYHGYFLAVQTDAPRKGLPILISEWRRYRLEATANCALIIKFSALDVGLTPVDTLLKFSSIATVAARGETDALSHVYVIIDHLAETSMHALFSNAIAFVVSSYGEGFGGTIVEAAQLGCPCIAPDHTAIGQLVAYEYPLRYDSLPLIGSLIDQLSVQPSNGSWHLPRPGAITGMLKYSESMSEDRRSEIASLINSHILSILAPELVAKAFADALFHAENVPLDIAGNETNYAVGI